MSDLVKGRFGKGFRSDHTRAGYDVGKTLTTRHLLGAPLGVPAEYSLEDFAGAVWDQGQTSSCVGWAFAQALALRCAVMKTPIAFPSPVAFYTLARAKERNSPDDVLKDEGSIPSFAVEGANEFGVPSMDVWPFDPATINDEPPLEELEYASAFKLTGYYRVASSGAQRLADFKNAISSGFPIVIGTSVDQAFEDYNGTGIVKAPDPNNVLGGHMMHILGYTADGKWRGKNQWGESWGDGGLYWADDSFITSALLTDAFVLTVHATGN